MQRYRLGILASHPIQYQVPWFRYLAKRMDIEVFYAHRQDAKGQAEAGFGVKFDWDVPLLNGYPHRWLKNIAVKPTLRSFNGCDTPEIYDIVSRKKFDAFLIFGWSRKSFVQAIRACWREKVPILMRGDSNLAAEHFPIKTAIKYFPYRWFLSGLNAHLYVGKRNREYLEHYGVPKDRLFFSPHFVDNDFFCRKAEGAEKSGESAALRKKFVIPKDAFIFLFIGKMIPKKRPIDFIQAALKLIARERDAKTNFLLVGDGPLRSSLKSMAMSHSDQIHFAGFQNQSQMPAFYKASNALVLPSNGDETWGLVVNEAFACGIPAIVSDRVGCVPDLIDENKTGFTYSMGRIDVLVDRMKSLIGDFGYREEEIKKNLAEKICEYSLDRATHGLEEALESKAVCKI